MEPNESGANITGFPVFCGNRKEVESASLAQAKEAIGASTAADITDAGATGIELMQATTPAEGRAAAQVAKVFAVSNYGASPSATAAANVIAIQAALDAAHAAGGGMVVMDAAGDYEVDATLRIYAHTKWVQVPGAWLKKSGANYSEVMANDGTWTGETDEDIHFENLAIDCNANGVRSGTFWHSHAQFYLSNIKNVRVAGCRIINTNNMLYCFQVCSWRDVLLDDLWFQGGKDGLHVNTGERMIVRNLRGSTVDDLLNFNSSAGWYLTCQRSGDIKDVVLEGMLLDENVPQMRCSMSAWDDWHTGQTYYPSERVVNDGRIYVRLGDMATADALVASVAPVHTSGLVTGADGIGWRYDRDISTSESDYYTVTENITIRNSRIGRQWQLDSPSSESANRHVTPGQEGNAVLRSVTWENCVFGNSEGGMTVLAGQARWENLAFLSCRFVGGGWSSMFSNTNIVDPWDGTKWSDLVFTNCFFEITNAWIGMVNAKHPQQKIRIAGTGNRIGPDHIDNYIHCRADAADFDLPLRVGLLDLQGGDRMRVRVASDPLEGMWNYSYGVYRREGAVHSVRRLGINPYFASSGASAEGAAYEDTMKLLTGNNANGFAMVRLTRQTAVQLDQVMRFSIPWVLSGQMYVRASSNSVIRMMVGLPTDHDSAFAANADADAFDHKFIGFEIRRESETAGNLRIRVIGHDGTTYRTSAWHDLGVSPNVNRLLAYQILNRADGNVELRAAAVVVTNGTKFPALPEAAVASIDNGPIDSDALSGNSAWVIATTNGTTSCNFQCQVAVEPPVFELLEFA